MATLRRRTERPPPPPQIPGSRAKIPLNPGGEEGTSQRSGGKPANRKLVRVRTQRVPVLQVMSVARSLTGGEKALFELVCTLM